jgi:hypothetical protein
MHSSIAGANSSRHWRYETRSPRFINIASFLRLGVAKRSMQDFIKRAVEKLNSGQNEGCDTPLSKPASDSEPHSTEQSSH